MKSQAATKKSFKVLNLNKINQVNEKLGTTDDQFANKDEENHW